MVAYMELQKQLTNLIEDVNKIILNNEYDNYRTKQHLDDIDSNKDNIYGKTSIIQNAVLINEISTFYDILEVLVNELKDIYSEISKDRKKIKKIIKESEFFDDERIKWALKEFHQMVSKTDKSFNGE